MLISHVEKFKDHVNIGDTNINILDKNSIISNEQLCFWKNYLPTFHSVTSPASNSLHFGSYIDDNFGKLTFKNIPIKSNIDFTVDYPIEIRIFTEKKWK